jgi:hypothetical protein
LNDDLGARRYYKALFFMQTERQNLKDLPYSVRSLQYYAGSQPCFLTVYLDKPGVIRKRMCG